MDTFLKAIHSKIKNYSNLHNVIFCAMTCEKMLPNYRYFSDRNNLDNTLILEDSLLVMYNYVFQKSLSKNEIYKLINSIEDISPDLDESEDLTASYALDVCSAFSESMNYILDSDIECVLNVCSFARDTVDMFIQEYRNLDPNDMQLEYKIQKDDFYIRELNRQINVADYLGKFKVLEQVNISELRIINNELGSMIELERLY